MSEYIYWLDTVTGELIRNVPTSLFHPSALQNVYGLAERQREEAARATAYQAWKAAWEAWHLENDLAITGDDPMTPEAVQIVREMRDLQLATANLTPHPAIAGYLSQVARNEARRKAEALSSGYRCVLYQGHETGCCGQLPDPAASSPASRTDEPPPLWKHAINECNEAHATLDAFGADKTREVRRREGDDNQLVTIGLADRICSLKRLVVSAPAVTPTEWQPIETAPQNIDILVIYHTDNPCAFITIGALIDGRWSSERGRVRPTHWMPLPSALAAPPATPTKDGDV